MAESEPMVALSRGQKLRNKKHEIDDAERLHRAAANLADVINRDNIQRLHGDRQNLLRFDYACIFNARQYIRQVLSGTNMSTKMKWSNREEVTALIERRENCMDMLKKIELGQTDLSVKNTRLYPASDEDGRALTAIALRSIREDIRKIDAALNNHGIEIED